ncbi:MAG TPA: hypothetical protein VH880_13135 [Anaeromyxobacteraceae bacterium]|jgi:hypothetical protein
MTPTAKLTLASSLALALAACGGTAPASARIGPAGGHVRSAGGAQLSVPAGALEQEVEISIVEAESRNGIARFQLEPRGLALAAKATVSVRAPGAGPTRLVGMENETEHALENEREVEHGREAEIEHLAEVELRHMNACAPACGAGFECDDGACKPHPEDPGAPPVSGNCPDGMELDLSDGVCKPHGGGPEDPAPGPAACPIACGTGLHCEEGACVPDPSDAPAPSEPTPCPDGWELDASDGTCKPHGGSGGGSGQP